VAVIVGEAAVRIRPDVDAGEFRSEVEKPVGDALEDAGGSGAAKFTAAFGAALAIGGAFAQSLEQAALGDKLAAQLGLTPAESERVGGIAGDLYANAYGDSLETVNDAVGAVMTSIGGMNTASSADLEAVTANALDFATAMNVDVAGAATSAGILVRTGLADNAENAFDLMTVAAQEAGPAMVQPVLDAVNEYGTNFAAMGFSGEQAMALLVDASEGGEIALDKAGDAVKEFGIRATDLGDTGAQEALKGIGLDGEDMANALLAGGETAQGAFGQIVAGLQGIDDPAAQASAAVALFGTPLEDIGKDKIPGFLDSMSMAGGELENVAGAADRMGGTLNDNASTNLTTFSRGMQQAFVDIVGGQVVPIVEGVTSLVATLFGPALEVVGGIVSGTVIPAIRGMAEWIANNQTPVAIVAGLIAAVFVPGLIAMGIQAGIAKARLVAAWVAQQAAAIASVATQSGQIALAIGRYIAMGAQAAATAVRVVAGWVLMGAQSLLAAARMAAAWVIAMGPVGWIIALVVGLVILIAANWQKVKDVTVAVFTAIWEWILGAWEWIKDAVSAGLQAIVTWFMNWTILGIIISHWDQIVAFIGQAWTAIKDAVSAGLTAVVDFLSGLPGRIWGALSSLGAFLWGIASSAWQMFSDAVNAGVWFVIGIITGLPGQIWGVLSGVGRLLWDIASGAFRMFSDAVGGGVRWVIDTVAGIPGRILSALAGVGSLLVGLGGDIIRGLVNGISNAAGFVGDVAGNIWRAIKGFVNSNVIDRLNGLLEFTIAGVHVNPPDIPRLHSGGVFDSGRGEGLALLRDDELVATPEQRRVADDLLRGLLAGQLPGATTTRAAAGGTTVHVTENVYAAPGESAASIAARATQGVVWNLSAGITRPAPLGATS